MSTQTPGSGVFAELRDLLLAPEQEDLRQLRRAVENGQSADKISRSLPEAVQIASQRDWHFESALRPVVEQSIRGSVRRDPSILASALSPLIMTAVKNAVVSALRQMAESIQETLEQSVTARGVLWRLEAIRTGRPYSEIVLVRSLLYRVDRVLLIHQDTGLLLAQASAESGASADGDLVSAMLTAIQDFVKDSFGSPSANTVEIIEAGEFVIWTQQKAQIILAALIRGVPPKELKKVFESTLDRICNSHGAAIAAFQGDVSSFESCRKELASCLLGQGKTARRNTFWPLWALAALVAVAIGVTVYWQIQTSNRWRHFLDTLRREPGIVITETGTHGGKYFVSGLRDPLARDPLSLLTQAGYSASDAEFDWQGYLSMQPPFVDIRSFEDARSRVQARRIHFPTDKAQIPSEQLGVVEDLADDVKMLLRRAARIQKAIRIEIAGQADDSGTDERNTKLSDERAAAVLNALVSAGIPSQTLSRTRATEPQLANSGSTDWKRATRRNVSFHVVTK